MGHVWIFQPYNNQNTNLKNNTKMGHWAQNQASAMTIPVLWPEPCRKWVRWTEEKKLWIWRIWRDYILMHFFILAILKRGGAAWYVPPCLPVSVKMTSTHRKTLRVSKHFRGPLISHEHQKLKREWVRQVFASSFNSKSRGTAILINKKFSLDCQKRLNTALHSTIDSFLDCLN